MHPRALRWTRWRGAVFAAVASGAGGVPGMVLPGGQVRPHGRRPAGLRDPAAPHTGSCLAWRTARHGTGVGGARALEEPGSAGGYDWISVDIYLEFRLHLQPDQVHNSVAPPVTRTDAASKSGALASSVLHLITLPCLCFTLTIPTGWAGARRGTSIVSL